MNILAILFVLAGIFVYFLLKPQLKPIGNIYKVAAAGDATHASKLVRLVNNLSNKNFILDGKTIDAGMYEIFIVEGESMAHCGIHTGNGLLVNRYTDKLHIPVGSVVVYEVNRERYLKEHPELAADCGEYKVRQLLGYAKINEDNGTIYNQLKGSDADLSSDFFKKTLFGKLDKARKYGITDEIVTVSITYKEGQKDYSIHTLTELYGLVMYIIPKEQIIMA